MTSNINKNINELIDEQNDNQSKKSINFELKYTVSIGEENTPEYEDGIVLNNIKEDIP